MVIARLQRFTRPKPTIDEIPKPTANPPSIITPRSSPLLAK
jgi:hypothetical protein